MNTNNIVNFLLIMPRLVQNVGDGYVFPLGIPYISSSLKKTGFNVKTLNLNHCEGSVFDILKNKIKENNINVVATGGLSPQYHLVKSIIESVKKIDSKILTIVGGGIISSDQEIAMEALEFADFGVVGEGEITICELASALQNNDDLNRIDGIIFKKNNKFIKTNPRKDIEDISLIPWPDYEGFDIDKYLEVPSPGFAGLTQTRMICMMGSRSCPFNCTFCFHSTGKKYRRRSLDDFFNELDYLVSKYDIKYISMADELFAPDLDRVRDFCDRIKKYNISWYADFRIDTVKPELLTILKESGLDVMFFGLESADNRILKSMNKKITIEQTEKILKMVYDSGIAVYGCFIFGDIEETWETANNTLNWWKSHSDYNVHLTLVKPFPGSYIYKYACENDIIKDRIQYLKDGCPQINISKMSDDEFSNIIQMISEAQYVSNQIESLKLIDLDSKLGRETISGVCSKCHNENLWKNIKLFALDYIYCEKCGQKFDIPSPDIVRENIDKNIENFLKKYGKVAIWGMSLSIMNLFKSSKVLKNKKVFPIDISESKRQMNLYGKKIYSPKILDIEKIPVVLIAIPSHYGQILCQVKENHIFVNEIIDICSIIEYIK